MSGFQSKRQAAEDKLTISLRDLVIERILFAVSEEELREVYALTEDDILDMSDLDLFELYEEVCYE